jgi:hypothetical protein
MDVDARVNDGTKDVVSRVDVVVHGITLVVGRLHAVGSSTLFCKVDDGVGSLIDEQLNKAIVVLCHIQQDKTDGLLQIINNSFV